VLAATLRGETQSASNRQNVAALSHAVCRARERFDDLAPAFPPSARD
jgi:hypothetical protein